MSKETSKEILNYFFPDNPVQESQINEAMIQLAAEMLYKASEITKTVDKLPKTPGFMPGPTWLAMQSVYAIWRMNMNNGVYQMAINPVSAYYRSRYELAVSYGINP